MLKAVEAIIEPDGTIRILEPLSVQVSTRAILTLLTPSFDATVDNETEQLITPKRQFPIPELAGTIKTIGDIVSPIVEEEDWECLK
ncbi:hypothetical protein [Synechococcus sp. PCC 6312]|uniref:hypothetical protein n=1 Tax=Synechococcus sp. (strain ATCC 27167 / PCC 6312) TaxID=195253 RepID=UPI00029ECD94|nr:hypothetical protein [Synechococcus sp. PCC 6312]AFY60097.1 hypothetical protein Syn6312_0889 [Synechococcus sp. PCC 6312]